jgi:hypothetical protein
MSTIVCLLRICQSNVIDVKITSHDLYHACHLIIDIIMCKDKTTCKFLLNYGIKMHMILIVITMYQVVYSQTAHAVTSIKQSLVLKGHLLLVLS